MQAQAASSDQAAATIQDLQEQLAHQSRLAQEAAEVNPHFPPASTVTHAAGFINEAHCSTKTEDEAGTLSSHIQNVVQLQLLISVAAMIYDCLRCHRQAHAMKIWFVKPHCLVLGRFLASLLLIQEKESYMRELEELIPQCEGLMADKASLEEQLEYRGQGEQELQGQLERLRRDYTALESALQGAKDNAQQVGVCFLISSSTILASWSLDPSLRLHRNRKHFPILVYGGRDGPIQCKCMVVAC